MSQHDFDIANQLMAPARSDINAALKALASNSAGATAPAAPQQWQLWLDTSTGAIRVLRIWDGTDWIAVMTIDPTGNIAGSNNLALHDGGSTAGSGTAQTAALAPPIAAYATGQLFTVKAGVTNTGNLTLALNGLVAKAVKDRGGAQLGAGSWLAGRTYVLRYDGTDLIVLNDLPLAPKMGGPVNRDMSAASGSQSITGLGFRPRMVTIEAVVVGTSAVSFGRSDGTQNTVVFSDVGPVWSRNSASCLFLRPTAGNQQVGIMSIDADGFTLAFTKTGTPAAATIDMYWRADP